MKFKPGDRVVVKSSGTKATVIEPRAKWDEMRSDLGLICLRLDGKETCFMDPKWVDYLNPVDWLAELA